MVPKIRIIACKVLEYRFCSAAEKLNIEVETCYLEAGLHDRPDLLKQQLQSAVDDAGSLPPGDRPDLLVIGYGLCGGGVLGIQAGRIPLAIPRVHDCISLFLGSKRVYKEQFSNNPGTFYMTKGWYENKTQPMVRRSRISRDGEGERWNFMEGFSEIREKYGKENADSIYEFLNSWKKNYTRSVFIDNGEGSGSRYADYARDLAENLNWKYESVSGSNVYIELLFNSRQTTDDILLVHPGQVIAWDPLQKGLYAHDSDNTEDLFDRPLPESEAAEREARKGLGLGIDAGGTYTDAVIYDFDSRIVLAKSKAPTTRWDFTAGIGRALDGLGEELLERVDITVVSTTLATNAIVEDSGQRVGLLLMTFGSVSPEKVLSSPWALVRGGMNIDGEVTEDIDEQQILEICRGMIDHHGVGAFAVSGYGSTINPSQEIRIKKLIENSFGMGVCCGHELSSTLNFYVRANTAVLNAGIIPLLARFDDDLAVSVSGRGIQGPVMIVRGDGSLMSREKAVLHPVETALSGPAASAAGAGFMTGCREALVIDVGGTTSDIGVISDGRIRLTEAGAHVGRWRTHIKAVDMFTHGTGGDSRILICNRTLTVGPRRVAPAGLLSSVPGADRALAYIETMHTDFFSSTGAMEILCLTGRRAEFPLSREESRIVGLLEERPYSLKELSVALDAGLWHLLKTERLEKSALVQRYGLTPTDLLCASGHTDIISREISSLVKGLYSIIWGGEEDSLETSVFETVTDNLLETLVLQELDIKGEDAGKVVSDPVFQTLMNRLSGNSRALGLQPFLKGELIGVGAAAPFILKKLSDRLGSRLIIPENGDVANAVGAVSSRVCVSRRAEVSISEDGQFIVAGLPESRKFENFDDACSYLEGQLGSEIKKDALLAGTNQQHIEWKADNRISTTAKGGRLFLGRCYEATITGLPSGVISIGN